MEIHTTNHPILQYMQILLAERQRIINEMGFVDFNDYFVAGCKRGHIATVRYFLEMGLDCEFWRGCITAGHNGHLDVIRLLCRFMFKKSGHPPTQADMYSQWFFDACTRGYIAIVKFIVEEIVIEKDVLLKRPGQMPCKHSFEGDISVLLSTAHSFD